VNNDKKSENNSNLKGNNDQINNDNNNTDDDRNQLVMLSRHLSNCLFHDNEEILLESARALGNSTLIHTLFI
jgi:hypothetical protein